jgi:hypothetical protein
MQDVQVDIMSLIGAMRGQFHPVREQVFEAMLAAGKSQPDTGQVDFRGGGIDTW